MNVGVILLGLILVAAASIGIIAMASYNEKPPVDTMGNTLSAESNNTHDQITEVAAPVATTGGGLTLTIAVLFVGGMLFAVLALLLYGGKRYSGSGR